MSTQCSLWVPLWFSVSRHTNRDSVSLLSLLHKVVFIKIFLLFERMVHSSKSFVETRLGIRYFRSPWTTYRDSSLQNSRVGEGDSVRSTSYTVDFVSLVLCDSLEFETHERSQESIVNIKQILSLLKISIKSVSVFVFILRLTKC